MVGDDRASNTLRGQSGHGWVCVCGGGGGVAERSVRGGKKREREGFVDLVQFGEAVGGECWMGIEGKREKKEDCVQPMDCSLIVLTFHAIPSLIIFSQKMKNKKQR